MRTAWPAAGFVLFVLFAIACRSAPKADAPLANRTPRPARIEIELDDTLRERLALGLSMNLELRAQDTPVGNCTLMFDLWDETYRVWLSRKDIQAHPDPIQALRTCVDLGRISSDANLVVHEIEPPPPLYKPSSYPIF